MVVAVVVLVVGMMMVVAGRGSIGVNVGGGIKIGCSGDYAEVEVVQMVLPIVLVMVVVESSGSGK